MFVHFKQRRMYKRDNKECTQGTSYIHKALHRTLHIVIRKAVLLFLFILNKIYRTAFMTKVTTPIMAISLSG
jgi:hypothetical protein